MLWRKWFTQLLNFVALVLEWLACEPACVFIPQHLLQWTASVQVSSTTGAMACKCCCYVPERLLLSWRGRVCPLSAVDSWHHPRLKCSQPRRFRVRQLTCGPNLAATWMPWYHWNTRQTKRWEVARTEVSQLWLRLVVTLWLQAPLTSGQITTIDQRWGNS